MKIALWAQHAGLIDLLMNLWADHDVRLNPAWAYYPKKWCGDEDIVVSTFPNNPESLRTGKPTIVYFTDPTFPEFREEVQKGFAAKKLYVIGAEDCYIPEHFIDGVTEFIPFTLNPDNYPKYNGHEPKVIIVNRKAKERWEQVVRGATGVYMPLERYLEGIPYEIVNESDITKFRQKYADSRVLFYFSNSPYTIVMFEAMTVGMPIVAFNHHHLSKNKPIEKYLVNYSIDEKQIRDWLKGHLATPAQPVRYALLPNFEEVKQRWNKLFEEVANR